MYQEVTNNPMPEKEISPQFSPVQELPDKEDLNNVVAVDSANGGDQTDLAQQEYGQKNSKETETEKENTMQDNDTQQVDGGQSGYQASSSMGGKSKTDNVVEGEKLTN